MLVPLLSRYHITGFHRTDSEIEVRKNGFKTSRQDYTCNETSKNYNSGLLQLALPNRWRIHQLQKHTNDSTFEDLDISKQVFRIAIVETTVCFLAKPRFVQTNLWAMFIGVLVSATKHFGASILYRSFSKKVYSRPKCCFFLKPVRQEMKLAFILGRITLFRIDSTCRFMSIGIGFPWMSYHSHTASNGTDYLVYVKYRSSKKLSWTVRVKHEVKTAIPSCKSLHAQIGRCAKF